MGCPQCQSTEINSSGKCMACGYQSELPVPAPALEPAAKDGRSFTGMIKMDYSEGVPESPPKQEIPQWRKDLSERLQAIKQKRETSGMAIPKAQMEHSALPASGSQTQAVASSVTPAAKPAEKVTVRKPAPKPSVTIPRQKTLQPLEPESTTPKPATKSTDPQEIQKLIDSVVSRQAPAAGNPAGGPAEDYGATHECIADDEGKLILLSRTLSGLIDLICIVLCTGIFILVVDSRYGIVQDSSSWVDFSVLFLLTYFVYSLFFLAASNQTIGMMITNLRVAGVDRKRPSFTQLIARCCCYLISLLAAGIGLLWSLFNRKSLCLHDRLSHTIVIRV
jgi:uncharacterized RDD family membrane protein YckC